MFEVVHTSRLTLRPWRPEEAECLLDIRRRPDVARWLGDPTPWPDVSYASTKIASWNERDPSDPLRVWAIEPEGRPQPVGSVSLGKLPRVSEVEVGWYLHPDETGQGFAAEAAKEVLALGIAAGVGQIWALMWPDNDSSAAVALAAGMTDLGVRRDPWYGSVEEPTSRILRLDARDLRNVEGAE